MRVVRLTRTKEIHQESSATLLVNLGQTDRRTKLKLTQPALAIPELHTRQLLILVHKFLHHPHLLPTAFANYFTSNSTIHQHNTREKENLHLTSVSRPKDFGKRSVKYKASKLWNQLPLSLKDYCSVKQFGSKLKIYLQLADIDTTMCIV